MLVLAAQEVKVNSKISDFIVKANIDEVGVFCNLEVLESSHSFIGFFGIILIKESSNIEDVKKAIQCYYKFNVIFVIMWD